MGGDFFSSAKISHTFTTNSSAATILTALESGATFKSVDAIQTQASPAGVPVSMTASATSYNFFAALEGTDFECIREVIATVKSPALEACSQSSTVDGLIPELEIRRSTSFFLKSLALKIIW